MGTSVMVFILLATIVVICLLLISNERKQESRHLKKLSKMFSETASAKNMSITSQESFQGCLIGVDAVKRQVLIVNFSSLPAYDTHIDLTEVKRCIARHHFTRSYEGGPDQLESFEC